VADDDRPQYQHGLGTIGGSTFHWGSGTPGKYWSIPYGDYPVTPNAPVGAWAQQAGAIPVANNVIPDPLLGRNRIGIMIHSGSAPDLDTLYTQGCFKVAPSEWPGVRSEILKEAANGPLYLHVAPGGVAAFTNTKTFSQAGEETPAANANAAANTAAAPTASSSSSTQPQNTSATIDTLGRNIAGIESGGWKNPYEALNPTTHAIGKYQVMPSNVPGWTQAALGQTMTPDEFRANPQAQEAVFRDQMQRNLQLYGPKDAASIWFTGKPYNVAGGAASDADGTTNANYVARATAGLDGGPTFTPKQAPGPIDPSIIARGGTSPPIPGTTINSPPPTSVASTQGVLPGFPDKGTSDSFTQGAQALDKALHGDQSPGEDKPEAAAFNFLPARNVSPLLPMASQVYGNTLTSMATPLQWGSQAPGQNPYANVGGAPVGQQFGTQLNSMQQLQQMMAMMGNPYGDAGYG
jgi:hypothetical protein